MRKALAFGFLLLSCGCAHGSSSNPIANGQAIFQTGKDIDGTVVTNPERPQDFCAACHRPDGAGGVQVANGVKSADLRHSALVVGQRHPYTVALLERAISTGIDNDGQPLNPVMPRWKLSQRDLHDVALYVFTDLK